MGNITVFLGGAGGPAGSSPGHVGVFGGVLMSQRRPTRRAWDGGTRRPILVRKQRVWTPLLGGPGMRNCPFDQSLCKNYSALDFEQIHFFKSPRVSIELGTGLATGDIRHPFDRSSGLRFRSLLGNTRTHVRVVGVCQHSHISVPQMRTPQPKRARNRGPAGPRVPRRATWGCLGAF